jgi:6-phosphogluconolactonase (cycloisomerase 2 family)
MSSTHPTRPGNARRRTARALAVATAVASATALFAAPALAATADHGGSGRGPAVFVQSDDPAGNTVVAYHRDANGTLSQDGVYATGGLGGVLAGSVVDHLASEGSLVLHDHLLYAVNAGSDTVTVFAVHGDRLQRVQVISSGGTFPVSVAVHGNLVYVANALNGGSVQGYARVGDRLVRVPSWHRDLGLDPSATPQFTHTPGQIGFTPNGGELIVTTKAAADTIDVFPLSGSGAPSAKPVVTSTPNAVPFGFAFDPAGRLQVTEAGPNAVATYTVGRHGTLTAVGQPVATGQAATCWITATGDHLYASNAGSAVVSGFRATGHGTLTAIGNTTTDGGSVDASASSNGHYVYVQTGAKGIVDEFSVGHSGALTAIGSVTVPGAVGGEGIAAG